MTTDDDDAAGRRSAGRSRRTGEARRRSTLVARLWRAAERQVREIEARAKTVRGDAAGAERDARALATLARTLRELTEFSAEPGGVAAGRERDEDGAAFREFDDFRRELARKLDRLREERGAADPAQPL
ncbi:hypothetical protein [Chelatococcus sp. XZ-Ab1]|uniref:hypothetical protein n=1 Tax=Chelatococcus sp. XZ-Ab1 TaxID=3034027 RepID=UPI0023E360BE|nr:hypothetical protein [Chelatococcus sp. XZ-Ab1]